jgi:hypothetical protein
MGGKHMRTAHGTLIGFVGKTLIGCEKKTPTVLGNCTVCSPAAIQIFRMHLQKTNKVKVHMAAISAVIVHWRGRRPLNGFGQEEVVEHPSHWFSPQGGK